MNSDRINKAIEELKETGLVITNVYSTDILSLAETFIRDDHAILLVHNDHGVERLYYYAHSLQDIKNLLTGLPAKEYVLEYITKNPGDYEEMLQRMGFFCFAQMMRMSVKNWTLQNDADKFGQYYDSTVGIFPNADMAKEVNQVLWNVFDTRVSHLLNDEEMALAIVNKEILIHQDSNGMIDAVLQTITQPKRFYINQVYNGADRSIIHAMMRKRLKEYTDAGGKYVYAWVDSNNLASIKFHQKYGLKHDGLWNMVYVL